MQMPMMASDVFIAALYRFGRRWRQAKDVPPRRGQLPERKH
jgi:hypothetical protein